MKLLAWNIQQGGAQRADSIRGAIARHAPDVVVLTELRPSSVPLLAALKDQGFVHQIDGTADSLAPQNGSAGIVARYPLRRLAPAPPAKILPGRWVEASVPALDLEICGLYGPLQSEPYDVFWPAALDALAKVSHRNVLVMGDFNTGESLVDTPVARFFCSDFFCELHNRGYIDLWRHRAGREAREYSWLGRVNRFRLDHAFGTRAIVTRLTNCAYSHDERVARVSDHSLLLVELV